jgi:phage terminase large subunit
MRIELPHDWSPRDYQQPLWNYLHAGGKRAEAIWPRRHGKDDVALHYTAMAAHERVGVYWHLLPQHNQSRKAIWDAVNPHTGKRRIDEAFPVELRATTREQDMVIRFKNGSLWQVIGSDNYDALVGTPPVGVVFSEWALSDPQAWSMIRPILAENEGWALFITTPRGRNHAHRMYEMARESEDWFCERLTALDTGVFSDETLERERPS